MDICDWEVSQLPEARLVDNVSRLWNLTHGLHFFTAPFFAFRGRLVDPVAGSGGMDSLMCVSSVCNCTGGKKCAEGGSGGMIVDDEEAAWLARQAIA